MAAAEENHVHPNDEHKYFTNADRENPQYKEISRWNKLLSDAINDIDLEYGDILSLSSSIDPQDINNINVAITIKNTAYFLLLISNPHEGGYFVLMNIYECDDNERGRYLDRSLARFNDKAGAVKELDRILTELKFKKISVKSQQLIASEINTKTEELQELSEQLVDRLIADKINIKIDELQKLRVLLSDTLNKKEQEQAQAQVMSAADVQKGGNTSLKNYKKHIDYKKKYIGYKKKYIELSKISHI